MQLLKEGLGTFAAVVVWLLMGPPAISEAFGWSKALGELAAFAALAVYAGTRFAFAIHQCRR